MNRRISLSRRGLDHRLIGWDLLCDHICLFVCLEFNLSFVSGLAQANEAFLHPNTEPGGRGGDPFGLFLYTFCISVLVTGLSDQNMTKCRISLS